LPPTQGKSEALDEPLQSSSVVAEKAEKTVPDGTAVGSDGRLLLDPKGSYFPDDSHETDENARKSLTEGFLATRKKELKTHPYSSKISEA
jgi:hypothetical protein